MFLSPFLLEDEYNHNEHKYSSSLSSATFPPLDLQDLLPESVNMSLDYASAWGSESLRQRLAVMHQADATNFLLCSGASEAILLCFTVLAKPGLRFLVQQPIYQSLYQVAQDLGAEIISWDSSFLQLEQELRRGLDAVVINNPNNPSGELFTDEQLLQIATLLEQNSQPYLIADEVFRCSSLVKVSSVLSFYQRAIVISDFSKSFSCPGLRLGWLASHDTKLLEKFLAQRNYFSLRTNVVSEFLAEFLLDMADEVLSRNKNIVMANYEFLLAHRERLPFSFASVNFAGPCLLPRITHPDRLFHDPSCFIATGEFFAVDPLYFRLGLGQSPERLQALLSARML